MRNRQLAFEHLFTIPDSIKNRAYFKVSKASHHGIIASRMSPETPSTPTKLCPTCGTRLAENATRCLVCGSDFGPKTEKRSEKVIRGSRMPEITLSLPVALGLLALLLVIVAVIIYITLRSSGWVVAPTPNPTVTDTPTITPTPTETLIPSPMATWTPEPPFEYTVQANDTCISIAYAFNVSVQSIIILNNLSAACDNLRIGQVLLVPYPTPTVTAAPTTTLEPAAATQAACATVEYTVQSDDTLSSISLNYAVPMSAIKEWNGLATDNVYVGSTLVIPLCMRAATPGPSPTPTIPPPYPAPNLLLPTDGAAFTLANDIVTLQWASIGTLRDNEMYMITIEDVTEGQGRQLIEYVTDTKLIITTDFRPKDNLPHVMRWWVVAVRQTGTNDLGEPIWTLAGAPSIQRVFTWQGAAPVATSTP